MLKLCIRSGKTLVEDLENFSDLYTHYTEKNNNVFMNPQFTQLLHNFYTRKSTVKTIKLTDTGKYISTVSTEPITTTTIKYKEGL